MPALVSCSPSTLSLRCETSTPATIENLRTRGRREIQINTIVKRAETRETGLIIPHFYELRRDSAGLLEREPDRQNCVVIRVVEVCGRDLIASTDGEANSSGQTKTTQDQ